MTDCRDGTFNQRQIHRYIQEQSVAIGPTLQSQLIPITTDMDVFPYNRFFRGMPSCDRPRVFDREAGHRRWRNDEYRGRQHLPPPKPFEGCFQIPCSTILPCIKDTAYKNNVDFCVYTSP